MHDETLGRSVDESAWAQPRLSKEPLEDPGDCNPETSAEEPKPSSAEIMDPVMVPVKKN